jgi:hypothetical protein
VWGRVEGVASSKRCPVAAGWDVDVNFRRFDRRLMELRQTLSDLRGA